MTLRTLPLLGGREYRDYRRRAIFSCHKWDPQVEDVATIAPFALALPSATWQHLTKVAERLAQETLDCETELWQRPELHGRLGLGLKLQLAMRAARRHGLPRAAARVMRFDFHPTAAGWALSEVNSDVPGGFNEATGLTRLMQEHHPGMQHPGDPTLALATRIRSCTGAQPVALVHCSSYSDDRQVIEFLADHLRTLGASCMACAPDGLQWNGSEAFAHDGRRFGAVMRFFPAEWLPELPLRSRWWRFFTGGGVPAANPGSALLVQGKRLPLLWDLLRTPVPTWRSLLPETCEVEAVAAWDDGWLIKPAWGRVGEGVLGLGFGSARDWDQARRSARRHPGRWLAQRRFASQPLAGPLGQVHACLGVYTIDGEACGIYGRIGRYPPIDRFAQEVAVLIDLPTTSRLGAA